VSENPIDLHPSEREALGALRRPQAPPPGVEERTVRELRRRGRLRPGRLRKPGRLAAAAVALFAAGLVLGLRLGGAAGREAAPGAGFLLLLYEGPGYVPAPDGGGRREEYGAWARARRGRIAGGEELAREPRRLLARLGGRIEEEDAVSPPSGAIAGFFLVRAATLDEALGLARECPHLDHGGTVGVFAIERR
jgi:hypothetical protein